MNHYGDTRWHVAAVIAAKLVVVAATGLSGVLAGTALVVRYGELHVEIQPCGSRSSLRLNPWRSRDDQTLLAVLSTGPRPESFKYPGEYDLQSEK